jgi:hypothetical protein
MPEDEPGLEAFDRHFPTFAQFIASLSYGSPDQVVGLYIPKIIAVPVIQQPPNDLDFVSSSPGIVTQFWLADQYGSKGFLAHANNVGKKFIDLKSGNRIFLVFGDKSFRTFIVSELLSFQALSPMSPYSYFRYLDNPKGIISNEDLFHQIYGRSGRIILQTCIEANGDPNWGRYFVVAVPRDNFLHTGLRFQP